MHYLHDRNMKGGRTVLERCTKRDEGGRALCNVDTCDGDCYKCDLPDKQQEQLAAYEDSGLSPEQVQELAKAKVAGRLVVLPPFEDEDYAGLKAKYRVYRARNGEPVEDCFVLQPNKDMVARAALECYASDTPNQELGRDILIWLDGIRHRIACEAAKMALKGGGQNG